MLGESIVHAVKRHEGSYWFHISTNEQILSKSDKLFTKVSIRSLNYLKIQCFNFSPQNLYVMRNFFCIHVFLVLVPQVIPRYLKRMVILYIHSVVDDG